ncbi:Fatty acid hydroxylase superfamily protein [Shimia sp. SK013]|uniref:sterol desaturase family protein n=1 Tax=Shimia sp. SK013 TaxID=1389006 RepID=UPI0006B63F1B|nr:sterol desaturase family protein [Shimia sp. SK013]KPA20776.1 Fatty acid hydroxylase superfamily protein [Shimia sp. SK013]
MSDDLLIRLLVFLGLFVLLAIAERLLPRRKLRWSRPRRWLTNWGFSLLNTLTLRLVAVALPLLAIGAALDAQSRGWGLFNQIQLPDWLGLILAVLVMDFAIWLQHLVTHKVPLLWRLHRVHHADPDLDVTTAIRFHPVEIALSMGLKVGLVYALGAPPLAVLIFEILLNATALFTHSNIRLPIALDRIMRLALVTPDMHRVHHSVHRDEHDSNYGFALSIWDRTLGTYVAQPREGHDKMTIGLAWQDKRPTRLGWSFLLPFGRK